jgi:hypothetical protein
MLNSVTVMTTSSITICLNFNSVPISWARSNFQENQEIPSIQQVSPYCHHKSPLSKHLRVEPKRERVGMAQLRSGRPRGWSSSPGGVKNFLHVVQTGSGGHPVSYPMGTGGFPRG